MIATRRLCRDNVGNGGGRKFCDGSLLLAAHAVVEMRLRVKTASCSVGHPISAIFDSNVTRKFSTPPDLCIRGANAMGTSLLNASIEKALELQIRNLTVPRRGLWKGYALLPFSDWNLGQHHSHYSCTARGSSHRLPVPGTQRRTLPNSANLAAVVSRHTRAYRIFSVIRTW
jgi:hypothetical protein